MSRPRVTVLMSVYNGEAYLREAIESVLSQTCTEFEFLIIDDCSDEPASEILRAYQDPRIRLIRNKCNLGLTRSLNRGVDLARGEYIARMDADDIALPHRLQRQCAFMDSESNVGVCGAWVETIEHRARVWRYPVGHDEIRARQLFHCAMAHPSVMIRRRVLEATGLRYNPALRYAQDYDLWVRAGKCTGLANIGEVLLRYRKHDGQIRSSRGELQRNTAELVQSYQLEELGLEPNALERSVHWRVGTSAIPSDGAEVCAIHHWLRRLLDANDKSGVFEHEAFRRVLSEFWLGVCARAAQRGLFDWSMLRRTPLMPACNLNRLRLISRLMKARTARPVRELLGRGRGAGSAGNRSGTALGASVRNGR